jgi:hypothetical protein
MLKAYYENMCLLANNTVETFRDFKLKDIIDIDRKWSRRMEGQLTKDYQFAMSFAGYTMNLAQEPYWWDKKFLSTWVPIEKIPDPRYLKAFSYVDGIADPFNKLPYQYLLFSSDCLSQIHDIAGEAHTRSDIDPSQSTEGYTSSLIEHGLDNKVATYNDVLDNGNLIKISLARVADQNRRLEQINAQLIAHYSRLILQDHERKAEQYDAVSLTINKLANGGKIQSIDKQRLRILGSDAGLNL